MNLLPALTVVLLASSLHAASLPWPDRGGPNLDGTVPAAQAKDLPVKWDEAAGQGIAWKVAVEGLGHSTPVIGEGRLWITAATEDGKEMFVQAVDPADGKTLLRKKLYDNADPEPLGGATGVNTYASPSCVLEPGAVYVHFGTYGTARLDPATGETVWDRRDIECRHFRGPGSSPILWGDLLILTFDGINKQFVTALDKRTGKTVWTTPRSTDYKDLDKDGKPTLDGDLRKAYHTPIVADVKGVPHLISVGARAAFGYDARTGRELWTVEHDDYNASTRPLLLPGMAILHTGGGRANLMGIQLDASTRGNLTGGPRVKWDRPNLNSDLSAPVLVDGRVYMATGKGMLVCLDAQTGNEVYTERLGGNFVSNLLAANGLVYALSREGVCHVVRAGPAFAKVAENKLSGTFFASPAAADAALFVRSKTHLFKLK
jgi:outer membrane protein assembly factor BamB